MGCGYFEDIAFLEAENLMWFSDFVCNCVALVQGFFDHVCVPCINPAKEERSRRYVPGFLFFEVKVHTEFGALVEMENFPAIEAVIYDNCLVSPALVDLGSSLSFTEGFIARERPNRINIKGFIINIDIICRFS